MCTWNVQQIVVRLKVASDMSVCVAGNETKGRAEESEEVLYYWFIHIIEWSALSGYSWILKLHATIPYATFETVQTILFRFLA